MEKCYAISVSLIKGKIEWEKFEQGSTASRQINHVQFYQSIEHNFINRTLFLVEF